MFRSKKKEEKPEATTSKDSKDSGNDKLIQIAVKFLANPKVEEASEETKKSFLKKKGFFHIFLSKIMYFLIFF